MRHKFFPPDLHVDSQNLHKEAHENDKLNSQEPREGFHVNINPSMIYLSLETLVTSALNIFSITGNKILCHHLTI